MLCKKLPFRISSNIRSSFRKITIDAKAILPTKSYVDSTTSNNAMDDFEFAFNRNRMDWNDCWNVSETFFLNPVDFST